MIASRHITVDEDLDKLSLNVEYLKPHIVKALLFPEAVDIFMSP